MEASLTADIAPLGAAPRPGWLTDDAAAAVAGIEPPTFPHEELERRRERARAALAAAGLDAILVLRPSSVEYLTGHHTFDATPQPALLTHDDLRLYVPEAEVGRALASASPRTLRFVGGGDALALIVDDVLAVVGVGAAVGVELGDPRVPPRAPALLEAGGARVVDGDRLVERLRLVLSAAEIGKLETAAAATERGARAALTAAARAGATDSSVAAALAQALREEANSSAALDAVVATGRRAGVTHSTYKQLPLASGTTLLEFAGTCDRYHAPLMVTFANRELDELERRLEHLAQTMLAGVLDEARPGRTAADVHAAVAARIGELDPGDVFHWCFAYAIGLAHPPTWIDGADWAIVAGNDELLEAGMAFHLPASFRSFGRAGVGLSHTVVLEPGGPRVLTGRDARVVRLPA